MFQKVINFLYLVLILSIIATLNSCDNRNHFRDNNNMQTKTTVLGDTSCASKFKTFADTLRLDTAKSLNFYFDDKKTYLNDCNLKKIRNNAELQLAVVLIILKIHNRDIQKGNKDFLVNSCMGVSETMTSIIQEFAYLVYDKNIEIPEGLYFDDIIPLLRNKKQFLKNSQIMSLYQICTKNNVNTKKRFVF